jgi:hypothetical protein
MRFLEATFRNAQSRHRDLKNVEVDGAQLHRRMMPAPEN